MKKFTYVLLAFALIFAACSKDDDTPNNPPAPKGPYASGIFVYGTTYEGLAFYDPDKDGGTFYGNNIYVKANDGETSIGAGGVNDICIYNGKIYILTPSSSDNKSQIVVCDAETLKKEKVITADGFNSTALGQIYNLMVVNENKFYIGTNNGIVDNNGRISVLTVDGAGIASFTGPIEGTNGFIGEEGPMWSRMLRSGNYVLAGCGSRLQFINTSTDAVDKTIELDPARQIIDILEGRDGNIYAVVGGKATGYPYSMVYTSTTSVIKIDMSDFSYDETELKIDGADVIVKGGLEASACASLTSDEIFMMQNGWTIGNIYSYNYTTKKTTVFAQPSAPAGYSVYAKYMATDRNGQLYVPVTNYSNISIMVFDIATGERNSEIEAKFSAVPGDGGLISTYIF